MPYESSRKFIRLAHKRTLRVLKGQVDLSGLQDGLEHTLESTLHLLPTDAHLLTRQGPGRGKDLNRQLAWSLAFVAGAINAGGFLAVGTYTSHVTGAVARMSDEWALGHSRLALAALAIVLSFMAGAFFAGLLINLGQRRRFHSHYALSLVVEAGLLLAFGFSGSHLSQKQEFYLPVTVILLSFIMGMHNAVVTHLSNAEVRTTHMTGIVTDIGVELSRLLYINRTDRKGVARILANRDRLKLHGLILLSFFGGGCVGALGFKHVGYKVTLFFAAFLLFLAARPILHDLKVRYRLAKGGPS